MNFNFCGISPVIMTSPSQHNIISIFLQVALLCFLTFTLSSEDNILTPDIAFVSISLFNVLSGPLFLVPIAIMNFIQVGLYAFFI